MTRAAVVIMVLAGALAACAQPRPAPMEGSPDSSAVEPPAELQYLWIGEGGYWSFQPGGRLGYDEFGAWPLTSFSEARFSVESVTDGGGCQAGDHGEYGWSVSPGGNYLQLHPVSDTCETRAEGLVGEFQRIACPRLPENFCLGYLEEGTHATINFLPMVPVDRWDRDIGAMTYRTPAGWTNPGDDPDEYGIRPQRPAGDEGIYLWSEAAIVDGERPCTPHPDPAVDRSPRAMVAWVVENPLLVASESEPATIGGLSGFTVDAHVRQGNALPCIGDGRRYAPMLVHANATGMQWGFPPHGYKRFWFLAVPEERTLVISIEADDEAGFQAILPEAMQIVQSMSFRR